MNVHELYGCQILTMFIVDDLLTDLKEQDIYIVQTLPNLNIHLVTNPERETLPLKTKKSKL